jgi:hypothetical protein
VNGRRGREDLAVLIERSADLKRDLVDFACSPRMERSLAAAMLEAGLEEVDKGDANSAIDRFALQYRLRDGQTVVDRFVASRPDLTAADREMLLGWGDPVEGNFEIRGDAIILLNLLDDLEYRDVLQHGPGHEIIAAIRAGKLQYRPAAMHGNPWLRLLRREVEELVSTRQGERYLREQQARASP